MQLSGMIINTRERIFFSVIKSKLRQLESLVNDLTNKHDARPAGSTDQWLLGSQGTPRTYSHPNNISIGDSRIALDRSRPGLCYRPPYEAKMEGEELKKLSIHPSAGDVRLGNHGSYQENRHLGFSAPEPFLFAGFLTLDRWFYL